MQKQQANPGGILAPEEVVGRDALVARLWRVLDKRSLYITAERRMGKTSVVRDKMKVSPPAGWTLITDPLDPWRLHYYEDRIDTHYPVAFRLLARAILDQLATGRPQTLQELTEGIDPARMERDSESVRKVLTLLGLDHYITREEQQYRFRSPFILRIWRNVRGLGE